MVFINAFEMNKNTFAIFLELQYILAIAYSDNNLSLLKPSAQNSRKKFGRLKQRTGIFD